MNIQKELQKEKELYLGTRCVNHPDFFPDECGCYKEKEHKQDNSQEKIEKLHANLSLYRHLYV